MKNLDFKIQEQEIKIQFLDSLLELEQKLKIHNKKIILCYDQNLQSQVEKLNYPAEYLLAVNAGEEFKSWNSIGNFAEVFFQKYSSFSNRDICIAAMGGGSVGDAIGFFASIYKRGVELWHIPSTALAAIDSAHGGKTAINFHSAKNQLGSFYLASNTIICKDLLLHQGRELLCDGFNELLKASFLSETQFWKNFENEDVETLFWNFLPDAIRTKYQYVIKDPLEKDKLRQYLNLGHSFGHIIEKHYSFRHGKSIGIGMAMALEWSYFNSYIDVENYREIKKCLQKYNIELKEILNSPIPENIFLNLLLQDKKKEGDRIAFISFTNTNCQRVLEKIDDLILFVRNQKWLV